MRRALLVALVLAATTAHADVWQRAVEQGSPSAANDIYTAQMQHGDDLVLQAHGHGVTISVVRSLVDQAEGAYRVAAAARPDQAEPYYRIATVYEVFYIECSPGVSLLGSWRSPLCPLDEKKNPTSPAKIKIAVDAWDSFELRAPLDPRVNGALFSRAIMRTKLVSSNANIKPLLEGALKDYKALLDRADGLTAVGMEQVWGNLAETYMMLGRLDESIEAYMEAIKLGPHGASTHYGLAVALDRDERVSPAFDVIRGQGIDAFQQFKDDFARGGIFYVPAGEEFYYIALISEAFGYTNEAIANWRLFLKSGAHPQYQPRAKAHLDALLAAQKSHPRPDPPPNLFDQLP